MTLEEEKKLVAEKLMGWRYANEYQQPDGPYWKGFYTDKTKEELHISQWEPNEGRKWWDEIWEKMKSTLIDEYHDVSDIYYDYIRYNERGKPISGWDLHTAKPETCWKALIKALSEVDK